MTTGLNAEQILKVTTSLRAAVYDGVASVVAPEDRALAIERDLTELFQIAEAHADGLDEIETAKEELDDANEKIEALEKAMKVLCECADELIAATDEEIKIGDAVIGCAMPSATLIKNLKAAISKAEQLA